MGLARPRWLSLRRAAAILVMVIAASLTFVAALSDILVDWTWFSALGYVDVFWIALTAKVALFTTVLVASTTVLLANGWLALHFTKGPAPLPAQSAWHSVPGVTSLDLWGRVRGHLSAVVAGAAVVLSFLIAWAKTSQWNVLLRFLSQVPFGQSDPVYGKDISFYLFSLPVYLSLKNWLLLTTLFSAVIAGVVYWERGCITIDQQRLRMAPAALVHASALLAIFFAVKAWSYYLDRFLLLYGDNGVVVGASYTDLTMGLPVLWVLIGLSGIAAVASLTNLQIRTYRLPLAAVALVFGGSFVLGEVTPVVFQRLFVKPNELELERPYLQHNIALTQAAYNLHQISAKPFPAEQTLTVASLQANQATIDNIRLWDGPPLMDAYRQLQEIRTYYKFHDVDVDRYTVNGAAQQLMLSARELNAAPPAIQCPNLGQPPCAVHARLRRDRQPSDPQEQRGPAHVLSGGYPARDNGGACGYRAAHLLRRADRPIRVGQGKHPGVRLPQRQGERLCGL